ncbi:MAG: FMN-dependent oxidoreductase (nitrilotriacetate monooxygenase family) [Hyphomicrobiaceae bacterium]|jgi:FMN-dependent oxidoreductase (nitrilotriacetate monooxygenase family)
MKKMLHLGAFMRPVSIHTAWWRYPGSEPDANFSLEHIVSFAQTLERGCFDAFFMADHLAVLNMPIDALKRSATVTSFDPLTLLPALSMVTKHLGLIATASSTFEPPYLIARRFASLDHISGGRAGFNLVTTSNPDAALNFGLTDHMEHADRYRRAREFVDVVNGLWDSWADDAFIRDKDSGDFFDPAKLKTLDHKGEFFSVRGPLNIARPVQGRPVLVQAGASEDGRQLAAETAEMIFTSASTREAGQAFCADIRRRMSDYGRDPALMKILPAALVVVADSLAEAQDRRAHLDSLVNSDSAIAALSIALGHDASKYDPDAPLPEDLPETNQSKSGRERAIALGKRDNLTVRQLAQRLGGYSGLSLLGTPEMIADTMEDWLTSGACDGFTVMFPYLPAGLDDFVNKVVPELQRRGLLRRAYTGTTLREHLGLPRPVNQFFA